MYFHKKALQSRDHKPYFQKSYFKKETRSQLSRQFAIKKPFQAPQIPEADWLEVERKRLSSHF